MSQSSKKAPVTGRREFINAMFPEMMGNVRANLGDFKQAWKQFKTDIKGVSGKERVEALAQTLLYGDIDLKPFGYATEGSAAIAEKWSRFKAGSAKEKAQAIFQVCLSGHYNDNVFKDAPGVQPQNRPSCRKLLTTGAGSQTPDKDRQSLSK
jgi:hypothetical protein